MYERWRPRGGRKRALPITARLTRRFAQACGWRVEVLHVSETDMGAAARRPLLSTVREPTRCSNLSLVFTVFSACRERCSLAHERDVGGGPRHERSDRRRRDESHDPTERASNRYVSGSGCWRPTREHDQQCCEDHASAYGHCRRNPGQPLRLYARARVALRAAVPVSRPPSPPATDAGRTVTTQEQGKSDEAPLRAHFRPAS